MNRGTLTVATGLLILLGYRLAASEPPVGGAPGPLALANSPRRHLSVTILPPNSVGQKAIVPVVLKNDLSERVESARAEIFPLDAEGKVVGQATRWIIGGDTNHPPLAVGIEARHVQAAA